MIMKVNKDALRELRVKEGKSQVVGKSGDPLDGTWTRPSKAFEKLLFIQQVGAFVVLLAMMLFLGLLLLLVSPEAWLMTMIMLSPIMIMLAVIAVMAKWMANRIYQRHRFRITDQELIIETGLITTNRVLIPLIGVQQVNVIETYWGRRYGLKNVVVNTAGNTYVPNTGTMWGSGVLMGLKNGNKVADALLSRVKEAKARANVGI